MKKIKLLIPALIIILSVSCDKEGSGPEKFELPGLDKGSYPLVDGSTSAQPLQTLIACKLLEIDYDWHYDFLQMHHTISPSYQDEESFSFIRNHVRNKGTHSSIINLINGDADIILVARKASGTEQQTAREKNVSLIETPVAIDAFTFIVNSDNPVTSLTTQQIRDIYTGVITRWDQVGGNYEEISPYRRNSTSGSQVLMEELVMKDVEMMELPEMSSSPTMWGPFQILANDKRGLCYTVYYYKEFMARAVSVKHIAVEGVYPDRNSLKNRNYPYTTMVYVSIRDDLDKSSMAYKLYELLLTRAGRKVIEQSGYVAY